MLFEKPGVKQVHLQVAGSNGTDNPLNDDQADQYLHNQVLAGVEGAVNKDHVDWAGRLPELAGAARCSRALGCRGCLSRPSCLDADVCLCATVIDAFMVAFEAVTKAKAALPKCVMWICHVEHTSECPSTPPCTGRTRPYASSTSPTWSATRWLPGTSRMRMMWRRCALSCGRKLFHWRCTPCPGTCRGWTPQLPVPR